MGWSARKGGEPGVCARDPQWPSSPGQLVRWRVHEAETLTVKVSVPQDRVSPRRQALHPPCTPSGGKHPFPETQKGRTRGPLGCCAHAGRTWHWTDVPGELQAPEGHQNYETYYSGLNASPTWGWGAPPKHRPTFVHCAVSKCVQGHHLNAHKPGLGP